MITYLLLLLIAKLIEVILFFAPKVTELPYGLDATLQSGVLAIKLIGQTFWPIAVLMGFFIFGFVPYHMTKFILQRFHIL